MLELITGGIKNTGVRRFDDRFEERLATCRLDKTECHEEILDAREVLRKDNILVNMDERYSILFIPLYLRINEKSEDVLILLHYRTSSLKMLQAKDRYILLVPRV